MLFIVVALGIGAPINLLGTGKWSIPIPPGEYHDWEPGIKRVKAGKDDVSSPMQIFLKDGASAEGSRNRGSARLGLRP
jgi:hypothetical protein